MIRIRLEGDELHERLGGGLPRGAIVLVEGACGTGKSALTQRLFHGALVNGARVSVVSTELTTPAFIAQMRSLGYPVVDALLAERLAFLPAMPVLTRARDAPGRVTRLLGTREVFARDVVVVDALGTLLAQDAAGARGTAVTLADAVTRTLKAVTVSGCTVIVTVDPSELPPEALTRLRGAADVHLELALTTTGGVARTVLVRRFSRAEDLVGDRFSFRVEPRVGVVVEIRSVG